MGIGEMTVQDTAPGLDDLLFDVVTVIELSDHDRQVAENRYQKLQSHLERPASPLRDLLLNNTCLIYPQGSMSIGATIISGAEDEDRFDVDALVDVPVPAHWSNDEALDLLYDSLQGFPDVRKIVRCTRCVQMQFAFMHMDVTMLDPMADPRPERVGQIFHSPDTGASYRVPSNPYGFSVWFRKTVTYPTQEFLDAVKSRRRTMAIDRLPDLLAMDKAEQEKLPPVIPPRVDAQQVHALKLMKRYLNLRYERRRLRRPPSIYFTKLSVTCGYEPLGLTAQLERFAACVKIEMDKAHAANRGPDERNPSYEHDRLNDRWPTTQGDRKMLADDMVHLIEKLEEARRSEVKDVVALFSDLFGEPVSKRTLDAFSKRIDQRFGRQTMRYERGTGSIIPVASVAAPAVARAAAEVPRHNFHCEDDCET
jgi:hypothetical protein